MTVLNLQASKPDAWTWVTPRTAGAELRIVLNSCWSAANPVISGLLYDYQGTVRDGQTGIVHTVVTTKRSA
ncbi:MAG: hypothetical protein ACYC4N_13585 [Pirellulaceae bacterium]